MFVSQPLDRGERAAARATLSSPLNSVGLRYGFDPSSSLLREGLQNLADAQSLWWLAVQLISFHTKPYQFAGGGILVSVRVMLDLECPLSRAEQTEPRYRSDFRL